MSYLSHFHANPNTEGHLSTLSLKPILLVIAVILQLIFGAAIIPGLNISGQAMNWYVLLALVLGVLLPFLARQKQHNALLAGAFAIGFILGCILSLG